MSTEQIYDFLDMLYGEVEGRVSVWWRGTAGSKMPYNKSAWFSWPADRDEMVEFIGDLSDKDVCVTTSLYSEDKRIPEFVTKTSGIWMDSDICAAENYRVEPSWTTTTSSGRWQHFWALEEPVDSIRASELVHRISLAHDKAGADQSSWPANKIMRVPGTVNTSHGFPTRVKAVTNGSMYSITELEKQYEDIEIPHRAAVRNIPELSEDELPNYGNVIAKLSEELLELVTAEPRPDQDRSRLRYRMLCDLFREGLDFDEALSVAWQAPASRKWSEEDARGLSGLIAEAVKALEEISMPSADPSEPYAMRDEEVELAFEKPVELLTEEERAWTESNPSFVDRYERFADERLQHDNRSYDRLNAWLILSMAYMDTGYIPLPNRKGRLNFFGCTLGETTSGKSSSLWLAKLVWRELYHQDPEFNLGGNASESGLVKALHAREGKPSLFQSDEAAGVFKVWLGQDWSAGMQERITELYDGDVNPIIRSGKGESVLGTTEARLSVFLQGTQRGVLQTLNMEQFHSGFIPRFLFSIGGPRQSGVGAYDIPEADEKTTKAGFDPVARQIAAVLASNRKAIRERYDAQDVPVTAARDVRQRISQACEDLDREFKEHPLWTDAIQPLIYRWRDNVHKAAALIAMDNRRAEIEMGDVLHALKAGEEWFTNSLRVIKHLSSGTSERAVDDMYQFVVTRGGRVGQAALYRRFASLRTWDIEEHLKTLELQGRMTKRKEKSGRWYIVTAAYLEEEEKS